MKRSPQSIEAASAGDGDPSLQQRDGEVRQTCAHCHADIVDNHWFCRLPGNEAPTLLCAPSCALHYFDHSHKERNGPIQDWDAYEYRFHFYMNGKDGGSAEPVE